MPSTLSSPIDLRKKTSPVVIIYGDDENQAFTRKVWDMIPNYNVVISAPNLWRRFMMMRIIVRLFLSLLMMPMMKICESPRN